MPPFKGKCLCGAVSYTLSDDKNETQPYRLFACHCDDCRQWTSGIMFSLSPSTPVFNTGNDDYIVTYHTSPVSHRAFCKKCGSNLYFYSDKSGFHMCAGTLEDYQDLKLTREVFIDACPKAYALENKQNGRQVLTRAEYLDK